jgi:Domain of unknown function (DUF4956)
VAGGLPGGDNRSVGRFGLRGEVTFGGPNGVQGVSGGLAGSAAMRWEPSAQLEVTLDQVHADDAALVVDLERRLGGRVTCHQVKDIDYVRDTMVVDVRHQVGSPVTERGFDGRPVLAVQR